MSGYRGRTGPNFSEYLNNLNTVAYDQDQFAPNDLNLSDDLAMFTNTDFTDFDIPPLSESDALNFDLDTSSTNPATFYPNYNTPIQPAPPASGFSINGSRIPTAASSPDSTSNSSLKRKAETVTSPNLNQDEQSRLAAEEDKRRRNTAASARFRVKKKQREQALERTVKDVSDKNTQLEARITQLEMENKWLKDLITEKNGSQSKEEFAEAYQKFRKESEERDLKSEQREGVGTK